MKIFEEKIVKTITDMDTKEVDENITTRKYCIKSWNELTREQKEEQVEKNSESIEYSYHEDLQMNYECDLEELNNEFKEISFDDIYLDSNSQGAWIDCIKNFEVNFHTIEVYGETVELRDVDYTIRRYIENVEEKDLWFNQSYIDCDTWNKIIKTKKFKNWVQEILVVVNKWIDRVNEIVKPMFEGEYYYPYNLNDDFDVEFLDNYFRDTEFEYNIEIDENGNEVEREV